MAIKYSSPCLGRKHHRWKVSCSLTKRRNLLNSIGSNWKMYLKVLAVEALPVLVEEVEVEVVEVVREVER